jgi:endonuclease/exonuclease/phosphatase family metal-dependent hydrolase
MRLASYNVENLFSRAVVLNQQSWADGKPVLDAFGKLNALIQNPSYSAADKTAMVALLKQLGLAKQDESKWVILRQNRGSALVKRGSGAPQILAGGRGDWIGWVELKTEPVNEVATQMTGRVIHELDADILGVVEADDRISLLQFEDQLLRPLGGKRYQHVMLIDGNDARGIDVGLFTRGDYPIVSMVSHVDDLDGTSRIFSRDCAEYEIALPSGSRLWVLVNHLKSKGFGSPAQSNARREKQARRLRQIYDARRAAGAALVAVIGDFNDTAGSTPLAPLFANGSELAGRDIFDHPSFAGDGRPGTFGNGTASSKIDFIFLSPALWQSVTGGGVLRKGVWGGTNGTLFPHYPEMTRAVQAASDHAAIWADLAV